MYMTINKVYRFKQGFGQVVCMPFTDTTENIASRRDIERAYVARRKWGDNPEGRVFIWCNK